MTVERIGVAGAGTMGAGIAQVACLGGFDTYLHDPEPDALAAGELRLRGDLLKGTDRGLWKRAEAEAASARLRATPRLEDLGSCELVIEAAPEDLELKRRLFARLAEICGPQTILATNTSSLRVGEIAASVERPERICGMHFFNPPALMELVELVAAEASSDETIDTVTEVAERMGRTPVRAADVTGFLANRCVRPFTLEALRLVGERVAPPDQVDRIVRIGGGYRMGPFELMDLIGVDVNLSVAESFFEQSDGEPRWEPHPLQRRMVDDGRLGRKSGRGWYEYADAPRRPDDPLPPDPDPAWERDPELEGRVPHVALPTLDEARLVELAGTGDAVSDAADYFAAMGKHVERILRDVPGLVLGRIVSQLVNEACFAVDDAIGTPDDIDTALRLGFNHPRGPFEWAQAIGPDRVLAILDALRDELAEDRYRAAPFLRRWAAEDRTPGER